VTSFSTVSRAGFARRRPSGGRGRCDVRVRKCQEGGGQNAGRGEAPRADNRCRESWPPGADGLSRRLLPPARRGCPPPGPYPGQARTGNPPQQPRELAARNASGHEHQGDEDKPRLDRRKVKPGGWPPPYPPLEDLSRSEPVKSASRPADGLRPHLTEPARLWSWLAIGQGGGVGESL